MQDIQASETRLREELQHTTDENIRLKEQSERSQGLLQEGAESGAGPAQEEQVSGWMQWWVG